MYFRLVHLGADGKENQHCLDLQWEWELIKSCLHEMAMLISQLLS